MAFPTDLTSVVDHVTEIIAAHLNNLEAKVGVDASAVVTSLDYLLKNTASVDPGHKHSLLDQLGINTGVVAPATKLKWLKPSYLPRDHTSQHSAGTDGARLHSAEKPGSWPIQPLLVWQYPGAVSSYRLDGTNY